MRLLREFGDRPRFTLVRAPAGFGKTMLLDQFEADLAGAAQAAVRLDLPPADWDADRLTDLLGRSLGAGQGAEYPMLLAALATRGGATLLIDNADRLRANAGAARLLERLAADCTGLKIVMAGRGDPGLALARHRASGDLLEIGASELLFDAGEQQAVLESWAGYRIPARQLDAMVGNIAGWPCGFGLQFQCLDSGIAGKSGPAIEGSWRLVADYFEQEVCGVLSDDVLGFLRRASVLERLSVEDCETLSDAGGAAAFLERAHDQGVPLWPIDPEHRQYAVLPLFRQFLRAGLSVEDAVRLGSRAADAFEERGRFRDACVQALDFGDNVRAAQLLERQFKADFALRGDDTELPVFAERIESSARERHPYTLLALAQSLTFRFEFAKARRHLDQVRSLLDEGGDNTGAEEARTLEMLLLHHEMVLALGQHELSLAQEYGDRLLRNMEQIPPTQQVMILNSLTYAQQELYIFRGAERYYVLAKKLIPELDSWVSSVPLETFYARHLFQTGRANAAMELLEETLARLVEELGPRPVLGSIAGVALAEIKFETNELEEAAQLLADYGPNVEQFGFLPMTLSARIIQARLHMARGEYEEGFAVLERPFVAAGELFEGMFRSLTVERIYWLLKLGRTEAAKLACNTIGLSLTRPPEPHSSAAAAEEAFATAWIQLARANKRIDEAIHVAQRWQRYTEGVGAIRSNVRWNVILASLQMLADEPSLAMRHLRRAVFLGAGGLLRGAFLSEADVLHEPLTKLMRSDLNDMERAFLASVLEDPRPGAGTLDQVDISVPLGTFSSREAAIVRLVAKGMLNREIGDALGMTEGTVKWYLQRIYDKLGIRRRSQVAMLVTQWQTQGAKIAEVIH